MNTNDSQTSRPVSDSRAAQTPAAPLARSPPLTVTANTSFSSSTSTEAPTSEPCDQRHWRNSYCCQCGAWYTNPDLQGKRCVVKSCKHIWCPSCAVTDSDCPRTERVLTRDADGIPKSVCCECGRQHAGYTLSGGACYAVCGHIWCGDCLVWLRGGGEDAVQADEAGFEMSTCCQCKRDYEGLVLDAEEEGRCTELGCGHAVCEGCWVRVRKGDGSWGTMRVGLAERSGLVPTA